MAYREMEDVLGTDERDEAATRALGRWRDRTRTAILAAFAIAGLVPGALGYWFVQDLQFRYNHGVALLMINLAGALVPWLVLVFAGRTVARRFVARRLDAKVAELAAAYEIPVARLAATANLVRGL